MEQLLRTSGTDLLKNRGRAAKPEVDEIEKYLAQLGYRLPPTGDPRGSGRMSFAKGSPQGLGADGKKVDNQKLRELRNARMSKLANCR